MVRWSLCAVTAVACGAPSRAPPATTQPAAEAVWMWTASAGGPWRLPAVGLEIAIAPGDDQAVVRTGAREVVTVDLATGDVGAQTEVVAAPATIESIARVGVRVLAFGSTDTGPAAWTITLAPVAAIPLVLPDPEPAKPSRSPAASVAVSPDGGRLIVCSKTRWPVVRDATTLAAIRVFDTVAACRE